MFRRNVVLSILLLAGLASAANAACPTGHLIVDLKTCTKQGALGPQVTKLSCSAAPVTASCPAAGWKQAVYKIAIPADCTQANVVVEYEGLPRGWTVNLGDSPTNNGFAGDGGTTPNDSELWVLEENLSVAASDNGLSNTVATTHLALADGALKFVVKDHFVSWGNPYSFVQALAAPNNFLFAIPDTDSADARNIYLGVNRVISGPGDRTGCGARRAVVSFN